MSSIDACIYIAYTYLSLCIQVRNLRNFVCCPLAHVSLFIVYSDILGNLKSLSYVCVSFMHLDFISLAFYFVSLELKDDHRREYCIPDRQIKL